MIEFFAVVGILATLIICLPLLVVLFYIFGTAFNFGNGDDYLFFTFFEFGLIIAKSEEAKEKLNSRRKSTGRTLFLTAPYWFNKKVYNIGGIKEKS